MSLVVGVVEVLHALEEGSRRGSDEASAGGQREREEEKAGGEHGVDEKRKRLTSSEELQLREERESQLELARIAWQSSALQAARCNSHDLRLRL